MEKRWGIEKRERGCKNPFLSFASEHNFRKISHVLLFHSAILHIENTNVDI